MGNNNGEGLQNAGITPKERLERIESMLERIDQKLDGKANESDLISLELRVRTMELELSSFEGLRKEHKEFAEAIQEIRQKMYMFSGALALGIFLFEFIMRNI